MNHLVKLFTSPIMLILLGLLVLSDCQTQPIQSTDDHFPLIISPEPQNHDLPNTDYDLIFLIDGKIMLWKPNTEEIETLIAPDILKYSLSENGRWLVAAKQVDVSPDNYELVLLDLIERRSQVVVQDIHCLHDFAISPDGKRLLYIADDWNSEKQICQMAIERQGQEFGDTIYDSHYHPPFFHNLGGTIYVTDFDNNFSTTAVGYCKSTILEDDSLSRFSLCISAYWTLDSQNIIWFDADGIWLTNLISNQPIILHTLFQDGEDHLYTHVSWSLSGKYLAIGGNSLSGNEPRRLILDWQTGNEIEAPYASFGLGIQYYMVWLNDDRLLFTKPMAIAETWKFSQDRSLLILEDTVNLASNDSDFIVASPHKLLDSTFTYALLSPYMKNEQVHGLYQMESLTHAPKQLISLPQIKNYATDVQIFWSPDGTEAIVQYWNLDDVGDEKRLYYISYLSGTLYEITQILGETTKDIQWLP